MSKAYSSVPFTGTAEQEKELRAMLEVEKTVPGGLMPALQKAQDIYGYLPYEVQKIISEVMGVPMAEVYGIVTFYSQFLLSPKGKYAVAICLGTACYVKGSGDIFERVGKDLGIKGGECTPDAKFSLAATRCIGCCGLAPVMTVNEDVYGKLTPDEASKIVAKYKAM